MDPSKHFGRKHRPITRAVDLISRYRRTVALRVAYGAATATGATAVDLIVVALQRHL